MANAETIRAGPTGPRRDSSSGHSKSWNGDRQSSPETCQKKRGAPAQVHAHPCRTLDERLNPFGPGQLLVTTIHPVDTPSLGMVTDNLLQRTCQKKAGPSPSSCTTVLNPNISDPSPAPPHATCCTVPFEKSLGVSRGRWTSQQPPHGGEQFPWDNCLVLQGIAPETPG